MHRYILNFVANNSKFNVNILSFPSYLFLGSRFNGTHHPYTAYRENLHVTFKKETEDLQREFDDNVNSASCICISQPVTCHNGMVVPQNFICDGLQHCPYGEDEMNCPGQTQGIIFLIYDF